MKNLKVLSIVSICCGMLFLTGCGKSHSLTCDIEEGDQSVSMTLNYNDDETIIESVEMKTEVEIPEGTTDEEIDEAKESFESIYCSNENAKKCDIEKKGNKLVITYETDPESVGIDAEMTLEDAKKDAEKDGATCK